MKLLPCDNCRTRDHTYAQLADGTPYLIGQSPVFPFRVSCSRCKLSYILTATRFAQLPEVTHDELAAFGLLETYARDLTLGHQLPITHAIDLYRAGLTPAELDALSPPEPLPQVTLDT